MDGENLMCFQSENAVFRFLQRNVTGPLKACLVNTT